MTTPEQVALAIKNGREIGRASLLEARGTLDDLPVFVAYVTGIVENCVAGAVAAGGPDDVPRVYAAMRLAAKQGLAKGLICHGAETAAKYAEELNK